MKDCRFKRILLRVHYFCVPIIRRTSIWLDDLYTKLYVRYCPIKQDKIVFDNFWGKGYGDNPRYIADEIIRQNLHWDIVWIVQDLSEQFPSQIRKVQWGSNQAMREWASAKMWVDNVRNGSRPKKKKGQIYLQTWHGSHGVKKIERQVEQYLEKEYVTIAKNDAAVTDAILVDCDSMEKIYTEDFWFNKNVEYLKFGLPRNDVLLQNKNKNAKIFSLRQSLGIDNDAFVVLYAPTFRDDFSTEGYIDDFEEIKKAFLSCHNKVVILIKLHPNDWRNNDLFTTGNDILNVTKHKDTQEVVIISDFLITDYSSIAFDFAILGKPVLLFQRDIGAYRKKRGLTDYYEMWPFKKYNTQQSLIDGISEFDNIEYLNQLKIYYSRDKQYDCGDASLKTVEWLKQKAMS